MKKHSEEIEEYKEREIQFRDMIGKQELRCISHEEKIAELEKMLAQKDVQFAHYICAVIDLAINAQKKNTQQHEHNKT